MKMVFSVFARAAVANSRAEVVKQARNLMVEAAGTRHKGSESRGCRAFSHVEDQVKSRLYQHCFLFIFFSDTARTDDEAAAAVVLAVPSWPCSRSDGALLLVTADALGPVGGGTPAKV